MKLAIVSGCWHVPFHNKAYFEAFCNFLRDNKEHIKYFILAGDFLDMLSISSHSKGKTINGWTLGREYASANKILDRIDRSLSKNTKKFFIYGNHEDRYFRKMKELESSKLGKAFKSPTEGLKLHQRGYQVFEDWKNDEVRIADFTIIHGEFTNKYAASKHLEEYKRNIVLVHTHRFQTDSHDKIGSYNIGWGGDKKQAVFNYASKSQKEKWRNGFGVLYINNQNKGTFQPIEYKNGRIFFGVNEYKS